MERCMDFYLRGSGPSKLPQLLFLLLLSLSQGCSIMATVPATFKEVKDYVLSQEQTFTAPFQSVVASSILILSDFEFIVLRIEFRDHKSYLYALYDETSVEMEFIVETPQMTTVKVKTLGQKVSRKRATETEILQQLRLHIAKHPFMLVSSVSTDMIPLYSEMSLSSSVVGYVATGQSLKVDVENELWRSISFVSGGRGYLLKKFGKNEQKLTDNSAV